MSSALCQVQISGTNQSVFQLLRWRDSQVIAKLATIYSHFKEYSLYRIEFEDKNWNNYEKDNKMRKEESNRRKSEKLLNASV